MKKNNEKKIFSGAVTFAIAKDGRSLRQIASELNIEPGGLHRIKAGHCLPSLGNFFKIREWMAKMDIDLEKMIRAN